MDQLSSQTSCSRCKTVFKMVSALHVLKVSFEKLSNHHRWHKRMQKTSSGPASDMFLIWTGQADRQSGQAAVDGACTNSRRRLTLTSTRTAWEPESVALNRTLTEYIYGCCAGLNLGSESNTGVFRQRCGHSQQTAPTVRLQSARHQKSPSLTLFGCFHPVKAITEKKKILKSDNLWQLSTPNFELLCHKQSAACHIFTFHGSQHTPTPPLRALRLRWMAYLHSHVTPRGKGARLCASLTRSAAALAVPLFFSTPRLGCALESRCSVSSHVHQSEELVGSVQVRTHNTYVEPCASNRRRSLDKKLQFLCSL